MDLLDFLKTNENTRKLFGKRELKIIEKQIYGLNLTQSEKNRLSRDIRKKFDFIEKAVKFEDEFKLKKGQKIQRIIDGAKEIILQDILHPRIKKIIIFGSAAENKLTFRSDIDFAVELSDITLKESTLFRKRILGKVNKRVDIQVYNFLPDKIKKEINLKGRALYKNEQA